jgi:hypothetical protein
MYLTHCTLENRILRIFLISFAVNIYLSQRYYCATYLVNVYILLLVTVRKTCEEDGRWRGRSDNPGRQWTNYSSCSVHHIMKRRQYTSVTAYAVTAVAVLPALVIFHLYR